MTQTAPVPAKTRLRRSQVQALLACPVWEPGQVDEASLGQAIHDAIAMYQLRCKARGEDLVSEVEEIAHEAYFVRPRGLDPIYLYEVTDLLDRWVRSHLLSLETLIGVEYTFTAETEHFELNGTVDRVDLVEGTFSRPQVVRIRDWKKQWPIEPHTFQGMSYGAYACVTWPTLRSVVFEADHIRYSGAGIVEQEWDRETLLSFLDDCDAGLHRILTGPRIAVGGRGCQYCARRGQCASALPPWSEVPATREEAIDAVQQLYRMEEAVELHRSRVRKYFTSVAPMVVGGEEIGFLAPREPSLKVTQPLTAARRLMASRINGIALLSMDGRSVPAGARGLLIDEGLATLEYGATTFKHRKAPEPVAAPPTEDTP